MGNGPLDYIQDWITIQGLCPQRSPLNWGDGNIDCSGPLCQVEVPLGLYIKKMIVVEWGVPDQVDTMNYCGILGLLKWQRHKESLRQSQMCRKMAGKLKGSFLNEWRWNRKKCSIGFMYNEVN